MSERNHQREPNHDWDINDYRTAYEPEQHWELRRTFMERHRHCIPEDELVCLAQVFVNVELLHCRYPLETMERVKELSSGVADEYRASRKNKLQRTFVSASDAAASKVQRKGPGEQVTRKKSPIRFVTGDGGSKKFKPVRPILTMEHLYNNLVLMNNDFGATSREFERSKCGKLILLVSRNDDRDHVAEISIKLGSEQVSLAKAVAPGRKHAKTKAKDAFLEEMAKYCHEIVPKKQPSHLSPLSHTSPVERKVIEGTVNYRGRAVANDCRQQKLDSSNIGSASNAAASNFQEKKLNSDNPGRANNVVSSNFQEKKLDLGNPGKANNAESNSTALTNFQEQNRNSSNPGRANNAALNHFQQQKLDSGNTGMANNAESSNLLEQKLDSSDPGRANNATSKHFQQQKLGLGNPGIASNAKSNHFQQQKLDSGNPGRANNAASNHFHQQKLDSYNIGSASNAASNNFQDQKLDSSNLGFKLLQRLGWNGGPLGSRNDGIVDPINCQIKIGRRGLGTDDGAAKNKNTSKTEKIVKAKTKKGKTKKAARLENAAMTESIVKIVETKNTVKTEKGEIMKATRLEEAAKTESMVKIVKTKKSAKTKKGKTKKATMRLETAAKDRIDMLNTTYEIDVNFYRSLMQNFRDSGIEHDLVFSNEFTKEERRLFH